jgi:hypothetical protein
MKNKWLHPTGFFLGMITFLLLFLWVRPELIFHAQQLGFSTSDVFFSEYAAYPGGVAGYISLFFFQFLYYPFWGALIYTGLAALMILVVKATLFVRGGKFGVVLQFLPFVIIAILLGDYSFHPYFFVAVIFLFAGFWAFKKVMRCQLALPIRFFLIFVIFAIEYYLAGGFALLVFTGSSILYLVLAKRPGILLNVAFLAVLNIIIPFVSARWIFFISYHDAYFKLVPYFSKYEPGFLLYAFLLTLPFLILISKLLSFYRNGETKWRFLNSVYFQAIQYIVIIIVLIACVLLEVDRDEKQKLTIDYLAHNRQWGKLLELAVENPSTDRLIQFQTTRALYHTGQLPEKMFDFPQEWGIDGLFLTRYFADEVLLPSTELFFDLGYLNEAIHYGNEAMSQNENSPQVTQQLILANLAAGKEASAKLYITELKTYPVFRNRACEYEICLSGNGGECAYEQVIKEKAALKPHTDFIVNRMAPQSDLLNLLRDHPENRMAYEYLMAFYLLNNDLASFVKYYSLGKQFGYPSIPTLYQQALILYAYELSRQGKTFARLNYDEAVVDNFTEYLSVLKSYGGNRPDAQAELQKKFGNTYWYYIHYVSPVTTNRKIVVE